VTHSVGIFWTFAISIAITVGTYLVARFGLAAMGLYDN
jgi:hypothetical protein